MTKPRLVVLFALANIVFIGSVTMLAAVSGGNVSGCIPLIVLMLFYDVRYVQFVRQFGKPAPVDLMTK